MDPLIKFFESPPNWLHVLLKFSGLSISAVMIWILSGWKKIKDIEERAVANLKEIKTYLIQIPSEKDFKMCPQGLYWAIGEKSQNLRNQPLCPACLTVRKNPIPFERKSDHFWVCSECKREFRGDPFFVMGDHFSSHPVFGDT